MRQQTLAAQTGFAKYGRKTRRERFLEEMEQIVPWAELQGLVEGQRVKATVRAKVDHLFRILKRIFGFEEVRYRGFRRTIIGCAPALRW